MQEQDELGDIISMSLVVSCAIISQMSEWRQLKMSSNFVAKYSYLWWCVIPNRSYTLRSIQVWKDEDSKFTISAFGRELFCTWGGSTNARTMWLVSKSCKEKGKSWFLRLADNGRGMEEEQLESIQEIQANRNPRSEIEEKSWAAVHRNCQCSWAHATLFWRSLPYPSLLPTLTMEWPIL